MKYLIELFSPDKIRAGIDCGCDYIHICVYHWRRLKRRGGIMGLVLCFFIFAPMFIDDGKYFYVVPMIMMVGATLAMVITVFKYIFWD